MNKLINFIYEGSAIDHWIAVLAIMVILIKSYKFVQTQLVKKIVNDNWEAYCHILEKYSADYGRVLHYLKEKGLSPSQIRIFLNLLAKKNLIAINYLGEDTDILIKNKHLPRDFKL